MAHTPPFESWKTTDIVIDRGLHPTLPILPFHPPLRLISILKSRLAGRSATAIYSAESKDMLSDNKLHGRQFYALTDDIGPSHPVALFIDHRGSETVPSSNSDDSSTAHKWDLRCAEPSFLVT